MNGPLVKSIRKCTACGCRFEKPYGYAETQCDACLWPND